MFDIFGLDKVNATESIQAMTRGMALGLLDGYELKLLEKDKEIERLRQKIEELQELINEGDKKCRKK